MPTYESIFADTNENDCFNARLFYVLLTNTIRHKFKLACTVLVLILGFVASPLLQIFIGVYFRDACHSNTYISVWLLINGACTLLLAGTIILYKYARCKFFLGLLVVFLIIWLQRGTFLVLSINDKVDLNNEKSKLHCNVIFLLSFIAIITYTWAILTFFVLFSAIYTVFLSFFRSTHHPSDVYDVARSA